ncbi:uncharacterized protein LOC121427881 [Lytechinus variegatus]|uniref:uncharacterized protein LOC121427881 n=1 Tax=Lytechinus variegatus TaxID=7654 RepID=UPI001BB256CC|nr:uncharacterized protein LOC121427881 [Lytechinus variegatus]
MEIAVHLLLYITTLLSTTWFLLIAAATDIGTPNVPTTYSPDVVTRRDIHYDVTTVAPNDYIRSETLSLHEQTTGSSSDSAPVSSNAPLIHTVLLTHTQETDYAEDRRTVPYEEGAPSVKTTLNLERTFETSSAFPLTELRHRQSDVFHTTSATEEVTVIEYTDTHYDSTESDGYPASSKKAPRKEGRKTTASSEDSKSTDFENGSSDEDDEIPEAPVHRKRNEGLVTEANINHAALWITVAFVAVLLVYITVLIIYNAKKRDWHQSLPPYTRFIEETSLEDKKEQSALDKMIQRITGKRNTDDGYSLSF